VHHKESPSIILSIDKTIIYRGELPNDGVFKYVGNVSDGTHIISLELLNKSDSDCVDGYDKAVIIDKILFFVIDSKQVLFNSRYVPDYSESYRKTSMNNGTLLDDSLTSCNYMGWNGVWEVEFSAPVFTWLHTVENLGWVYPS
jgi:hypothetical protein